MPCQRAMPSQKDGPRQASAAKSCFCHADLVKRQQLSQKVGPEHVAYRVCLATCHKPAVESESWTSVCARLVPCQRAMPSQKDGPRQASAAKSCFCHADLVKRQQLSQKVGPEHVAYRVCLATCHKPAVESESWTSVCARPLPCQSAMFSQKDGKVDRAKPK